MNKIINRKMYDTKTAKMVGEWDNGRNYTDFNAIQETLYRKHNGEFFLHGWGGALTQYAEPTGNGATSGNRIIPLTDEEARQWAEDKLTGDDYVAIFGMPAEVDNNETLMTIAFPTAKARALQLAAKKAGINICEYIDSITNKL